MRINLHSSSSLIHRCQNYSPYIYHPLQVFSSSLLMKTSCLRLKLVELNFLVSFNADDQSKTDVTYTVNVTTYKSKSSRWTFSIKELSCWIFKLCHLAFQVFPIQIFLVNLAGSLKNLKIIFSLGNRTQVSCVTGGATCHCTPECCFVFTCHKWLYAWKIRSLGKSARQFEKEKLWLFSQKRDSFAICACHICREFKIVANVVHKFVCKIITNDIVCCTYIFTCEASNYWALLLSHTSLRYWLQWTYKLLNIFKILMEFLNLNFINIVK